MLLFYPKPYPQETLLSFIYRVAREHEMSNLDWVFQLIEEELSIDLKPERVNWVFGDELKSISDFLGITLEVAEKLTLYHHFESNNKEIRKQSRSFWFLSKKSRYCPKCLKLRGYQKKSWISCHSIICIEHKTLLLDSCNRCNNIQNTKSIIQDECSKCKNKLSNSPIRPKYPDVLIKYQQLLNEIHENNNLVSPLAWIHDPPTYLKTLDFLALWAVKMIPRNEFSMPKNNLHFTGNILDRHHLKNFRTIEQVACLYGYVFKIISNWPYNFNEFINIAKKNEDNYYLKSFIKYGLPRIINTPLWEISKEFTNYIAIDKGLSPSNHIRSDEVKFLYPGFNGSITNSNQIKFHKIRYYDFEFTLIKQEEIDSFMCHFEKSYSKEELRERWGTSPKATYSILNNHLIEDAFTYKSGSAYCWVIPKSSVFQFDKKVKQASIEGIDDNPINFNHAVEWVGPEKTHFIIRNILNGSIKFTCNSNEISKLILDKRDLYFLIKDIILRDCEKSKVISYRDIGILLGIKRSDIQYWIESGRFGEIDHRMTEAIPFVNFMDFHKRFITTLELSLQLNLQIKQVIKRYTRGKLTSISGPKIKDGKRLLFLRQQ
ncbi:TniQ family protein [Rossellomorea aquimaris]|uniref:TniQ protein n=1 Tax=Rossellomorea aquimaris TaxID=189382 RepID=A0A366EJA5_9BACI|nr:TniQ family protein [Rossellomorea aquimaris]RBP02056.1 TniQ protein [Rossellomorea aquimaris]